jgi:hypothetical protein
MVGGQDLILSFTARISAATSGKVDEGVPGYRCADPGHGIGPRMAEATKNALAERPEPG